MKKKILILIFPLLSSILFAQQQENAGKLVNEGIIYHDRGDYTNAIAKYDKALELDKDNLFALTEKAYSLLSLGKYQESIVCCQRAIKTHPGDKGLETLYVTYGNALDATKKTDKSIEIYDEGIKLFPNFFQLYFNKGIALLGSEKYEEAMFCFQKSVILNPNHGSSHNAIARLSILNNKQIPALLAYCRFLVLEPKSDRAKENFLSLQKIVKGNATETDKKSVTVNINPDLINDIKANKKPKENSFTSVELILSMDAALDYDEKYKNESEVERFLRKLKTICSSLGETKKDNFGFFWEYYVPYFIEMKDKNMLETFSYLVFTSSKKPEISNWLNLHKPDVENFINWSKSFKWETEIVHM